MSARFDGHHGDCDDPTLDTTFAANHGRHQAWAGLNPPDVSPLVALHTGIAAGQPSLPTAEPSRRGPTKSPTSPSLASARGPRSHQSRRIGEGYAEVLTR